LSSAFPHAGPCSDHNLQGLLHGLAPGANKAAYCLSIRQLKSELPFFLEHCVIKITPSWQSQQMVARTKQK
jgi:hypothetical protein